MSWPNSGRRENGAAPPAHFLEIARVLAVFSLCGFVTAPAGTLHAEVVALVRTCAGQGRL